MILTLDFETRSREDLKAAGAWRYAEHPETRILCLGVKVDDQPGRIWFPGWVRSLGLVSEISDAEVREIIVKADLIFAHNAEFECALWQLVVPELGPLPLEKVRCTAAMAAYHALPRTLEQVGYALGLPIQKDKDGAVIMRKMCAPQKRKDGTDYWVEDKESFERLAFYCRRDVDVEYLVAKTLKPLPPMEQEIWRVDQIINKRGVMIDTAFAVEAVRVGAEQQARFKEEMDRINGLSPNQVSKLVEWVTERGIPLHELTKASVAEALARKDLPDIVRRVLEIRQGAARTSAQKYMAVLKSVQKDKRIRGMFMYHAATTGRYSSKRAQLHNLPSRGIIKDTELAISMITAGASAEEIEFYFGDTMWTLASTIRGMLVAPPGKEFIVADYSAIEARVLAWLVGEEHVLSAYRRNEDLYVLAAAGIYHKSPLEVTKFERQIGKVTVLSCIAKGQLVTTDRGLVPIEEVKDSDLVFDGVDFVKHDGVVYRGIKEVISYDSLVATPDHTVFVQTREGKCREVSLGFAAASNARLVSSGNGGKTIRVGEDHFPGTTVRGFLARRLRTSRVCSVSSTFLGFVLQHRSRGKPRVSRLLSANAKVSKMAIQTIHSSEKSLYEPKRSSVQVLRGQGDYFRFYLRSDGVRVYGRHFWRAKTKRRDRSDRQQSRLRDRECAFLFPQGKHSEQAEYALRGICGIRLAVLRKYCSSEIKRRRDTGTDTERGAVGRSRTTKMLEKNSVEAPVYDILNCGPRQRFVVSGRLVHNCGYQAGWHAFVTMAKNYGIEEIPEEDAREIVKAWRETHPKTVSFWRDCQDAAIRAIQNPGEIVVCRRVLWSFRRGFLMCRLPSGRLLHYPKPRLGEKPAPWDEEQTIPVINFWGTDLGGHWCELETYGGRCTENIVQAISRDLLAESLVRLERHGKYAPVAHVHDEAIAEVDEGKGDVKEFCSLMNQLPEWATGLPIASDGWIGKRYKK